MGSGEVSTMRNFILIIFSRTISKLKLSAIFLSDLTYKCISCENETIGNVTIDKHKVLNLTQEILSSYPVRAVISVGITHISFVFRWRRTSECHDADNSAGHSAPGGDLWQ